MNFEVNRSSEKAGKFVGVIAGYIIFTTILYFALLFLNKLPSSWNYVHIIIITLIIALIGIGLKKVLK